MTIACPVPPAAEAQPFHAETLDLLIVGAGFSGIAMAIRAQAAGLRLLVVEKAAGLGGTWRANTYPGAACDVPSHLYTLSFAPNPGWSRVYAGQAEIAAYLEETVEAHGLRPAMRFGVTVRGGAWDEAAGLWRVETDQGPVRARCLVSATGGLHHPNLPEIPGRARFAGASFHTSDWDHGCPLAGRRVGVIGTGASAAQVVPEIAPLVGALTVFQRTPAWIMPKADRAVSGWRRALYGRFPALARLERARLFALHDLRAYLGFARAPLFTRMAEILARRHLDAAVADPGLRERLRPAYRFGCKRVLVSDDYYPALQRPNVALETASIAEILPEGVRMADGRRIDLDVLVYATGFDVTGSIRQLRLVGRDGLTLAQAWRDRPAAHQGIAVAGFPNLFFLLGPNTGLGHNSVLSMIEIQVQHVLDCLAALRASGGRAIAVRPEAQARFLAEVTRRSEGSFWQNGGCASWYLDGQGRNTTLWPGSVVAYARRARRARAADYRID